MSFFGTEDKREAGSYLRVSLADRRAQPRGGRLGAAGSNRAARAVIFNERDMAVLLVSVGFRFGACAN
jgi:hypothetical protein